MYEPQRQYIAGVAVMYVKNLRQALNAFLAVIFASLGGERFAMWGMGLQGWAVVLGVVFLIWTVLQYLRFRYYVEEGHFIIQRGVFQYKRVSVPFARIQNVNTTQNVVQRLLNTVGLKIDTAGSALKEVEIPSLSRRRADALQQFLLQQRALEDSPEERADTEAQAAQQESTGEESQAPVFSLRLVDVLRISLTANHLRNGLVLVAIVYGYLNQYQDLLLEPIEPWLERINGSVPHTAVVLVPLGVVLFLVLALITSMITYLLRFYGLRLYLDQRGLRLISGLLRRNEYRLPRPKIQYFRWSSNPLRALIGYRSLHIRQASSVQGQGRRSVEIPGLLPPQLLALLNRFYPHRHAGRYYYYQAHSLLFRQLFTWVGLFPVLGVSVLHRFVASVPLWGLLILLLHLGWTALWTYQYYRRTRLRINGEVIQLYKGWLFPSRLLIQHYKLQNMTLSRSIFQRRLGLATLHFSTAAGTVSMPHLPVEAARWWYDYLLFRIETSRRSWM